MVRIVFSLLLLISIGLACKDLDCVSCPTSSSICKICAIGYRISDNVCQ